MKNIAFFIDNIGHIGGTERVCLLIANELIKYGNKIFIINKSMPDKIFYEISEKISISCIGKNYFAQILKLRSFLKRNAIDTIIDVDTSFAPITTLACFMLKVKHISWEHFNAKLGKCSLRQKIGREFALYFADKLVLLTKSDRENYPQKKNICVINNPLSFFPDKKAALENKQIISIGRLTKQKGFDYLIEAFSIFSKKNSNWTLKIVGDGELRDELNTLISHNDLVGKVELVGSVGGGDIMSLLFESSMFVMSSRYEGLPMALLEAMICGVPPISFDCPYGPKDIIKKDCGILVENGNASALADCMTELAINKEKRIMYGENARKEAARYDIKNIIGQWIEII